MAMELIDNVHKTLRDDLKEVMRSDSKISVAAASFSIYAYQELRKELEKCRNSALYSLRLLLQQKRLKKKKESSISLG